MYIIYGKKDCGFCSRAVKLLQRNGITFTYMSMDDKQSELVELAMLYKHKTVPLILQVVEGNTEFIGGHDDLVKRLEP
jgi:glutaredoxin